MMDSGKSAQVCPGFPCTRHRARHGERILSISEMRRDLHSERLSSQRKVMQSVSW